MNDTPREAGCFDLFKMILSVSVATLVFKTTKGDVLILRLASACLSGLAAWLLSLNGTNLLINKTRKFMERISPELFFVIEFTVSFLISMLVYLITMLVYLITKKIVGLIS